MKKRSMTGLAAGVLVAAMAPGVASAEQGGVPASYGCTWNAPGGFPPIFQSVAAKLDGSNAGPDSAIDWVNPRSGAPEGVPNAPGQNVKYRCIFWED